MLHIYVDADACPVKQEIYKVADRYQLPVTVVTNSRMRVPDEPRIKLQVVADGFDAADDWIADQAEENDIVITADIPLADRCVKKKARVMGHNGKPFNEDNIGDLLATRDLLAELRGGGVVTGGPAPMQARDRSRFLQKLDEVIQAIRREHPQDLG